MEVEPVDEIIFADYLAETRKALKNEVLQHALVDLQNRFGRGTALAYQNLPEGPDLRLKAHEIRMEAIDNLDVLLETLAGNVQKNGGQVFFAADAAAAVDYCLGVAARHNVRLAVKGKSMVSEEIGLNRALANAGIEAVETDLGEYIVQLAGEGPSHIIAPAIHKNRDDIGHLFADQLNIPYTNDPPSLTRAARKTLREKFLAADMGFSGCNLACAETGHITTVSNEGNIRMATTLPRVHVAIMGMERVAARLQDHDMLLRLLCQAAAAQNMSTYVSYIGGPRREYQLDGPEEFHLVILDNGRSRILADAQFREMLCCIRCAACLNICPVYGKIGGHSYGHPYSGPMGAVVMPLLAGINAGKDLCQGETLCGACRDACPINIDLPRMLLALRAKLADGDDRWHVKRASRTEKAAFYLWSWIIRSRRVYEVLLRLASYGQRIFPHHNSMIGWLPPPLSGWTRHRDMAPLAEKSFMQRWKKGR